MPPKGWRKKRVQEADPYAEFKRAREIPVAGIKSDQDPEVVAAMDAAEETLDDVVTEGDAEKDAADAFDGMDQSGVLTRHPIGNGVTIPLPYLGQDDPSISTCSQPKPLTNRGCRCWNICGPARLRKRGAQTAGGPFTVVFLDQRNKTVCAANCAHWAEHNAPNHGYRVLPGVDWVPSLMPEYEPLPNGQAVMPGPNQPKTKIRFTKVKNPVPCALPRELAIDYQKARMRGEVR